MGKDFLKNVRDYYSDKLNVHGATSLGVDWNGKESHYLRFQQLVKLLNEKSEFSILDFGSGFGSIIDFLDDQKYQYSYTGYDISDQMIRKAVELYKLPHVKFTSDMSSLTKFDYVLANGIFNVKLEVSNENWLQYIYKTIDQLDKFSKIGFAFNILTSYSDKVLMKDHLYYADPGKLFDYCKKKFSKNIALLHDYNLYEFTILVRK